MLLTVSASLISAVHDNLAHQLENLNRREIAQASLESFSALIQVPDLATALDLANRIAPEHLELSVEDPQALAGVITSWLTDETLRLDAGSAATGYIDRHRGAATRTAALGETPFAHLGGGGTTRMACTDCHDGTNYHGPLRDGSFLDNRENVLIFGKLGFPALGIIGAALGNVVAAGLTIAGGRLLQ